MCSRWNEIMFNVTLLLFIVMLLLVGFIQSKVPELNAGLITFLVVYVPLITGAFSGIILSMPLTKEEQGGQNRNFPNTTKHQCLLGVTEEVGVFMLNKRDIKIVTNVFCSNIYVTKKEKAAWFRIKKFFEESCQLPTTKVKSSADATVPQMPTSCDECPISQICNVNYCKGKMCREAWSALLLT